MSDVLGSTTLPRDDLVLDVRITGRPDGSVVLAVAGEVDAQSTPVLERALDLAAAAHPPTVLVDLAGVRFLNASGLRALHHALVLAAEQGWLVELRAAPGHVARLLDRVGLPHATEPRAGT